MKCSNPQCSNEASKPRSRSTYHYCSVKCRAACGFQWGKNRPKGFFGPRKHKEKACKFCGNAYAPKSANQSYCKTCAPDNRAAQWIMKYNVSQPMYDEMVHQQNGICVLCPKKFSEMKRFPDIDHCHTTGKVRGILCHACNIALRAVDAEDGEWLIRALEYKRRSVSEDTRDAAVV